MPVYEKNLFTRSGRLVLGCQSQAQGLDSVRVLRSNWDIRLTNSAAEVRRLVRELGPDVVLLDVDLTDESGWLTCVKLTMENDSIPVVLISSKKEPRLERFGKFVGAAGLITPTEDLADRIENLFCQPLANAD